MVWIAALCVPLYALGADAIGLLNSQEAFRATAAREMHARADWIVPTLNGEPYLAKPPMIYWAQLALARIRGADPSLLDLRLTTALAGWVGVVATYFLARRLAREATDEPSASRAAGAWSALGLAVGILYVRSARMGELDILIVPAVVLAIAALHAAWSSASASGRTHWPAIACAALCAAIAALTKGPVPLAVIGVAMLGAMLLGAACTARARSGAIAGAVVGAIAVGILGARNAEGLGDAPGVAALSACGAMVGALLGAAAHPRAVRAWAPLVWRCHLELVIGAGVLALWAWGAAVRGRIGAEAVAAAAARELEDNLRLLVPRSPIHNLEFLTYAMLPIAVAAVGALVWCIRERPRPTRGALILFAWILGGFILFSVAGKGVARYLTPVWPAIAIAGGWHIAAVVRPRLTDRAAWAPVRSACVAVFLAAAIGQGAWYAIARPLLLSNRSPAPLAKAMRGFEPPGADRLAIWDIDPLIFEYHYGATIRRWDAKSAGDMLEWIRSSPHPVTLLAQRETERVVRNRGSVRSILTEAGIPFATGDDSPFPPWYHHPDNAPVEVLVIDPGTTRPGGR
jgi:4-amino-4-deoxy-L-arabinose transferase-like glycosyltransferase